MPELWEPAEAHRTDGNHDAWKEAGSDELMDFEILVRIRAEAALVEATRERRIERRAE